jgi:L-lactate transport
MSPVWSQSYALFGRGLTFSAAIASLPILPLLFLLGIWRKPAWFASLFALLAALLVALFAYKLPLSLTFSSAAYGASFGLFPICWIVFWAIALYQVTVETGKFEIIKASVGNLTSDARLQALLIAFAFGAFVEGAAGFGTPVAVAAAMLVGLGFSPFYASALCLVANTAPVAFGSIGIPVVTLAGITGLPLDKLSAAVGRLCAPLSLFVPCYLVCIMVGWRGMLEVWPAVVVVGGVFASVQFLMSNFVGPQLTDIMASIAALSGLLLLLRFWRPASTWDRELEPVASAGKEKKYSALAPGFDHGKPTTAQILGAWIPYGLLVILVLLWGFRPFQALLNYATTSVGWPLLHNRILMMPPVVSKPTLYKAIYQLNFLSAAGTACLFATVLAALLLRMSPLAIAVAAAATAMTVADQAKLFRFTLRHSILMATVIGFEVMLYAYVFHVR